jgi:hypothetical protein
MRPVPDGLVAAARAALERGDVLMAYDAASALVAEPEIPFATEYVGRGTTAKEFETLAMYCRRRRR